MPTAHGPPSSTTATAAPNCSRTWAAVVGLSAPKRLALGAANSRPQARSSASATAWFGTRTATVSSPAVTTSGTTARRGSTRVSGPGQNAAARRRARALGTATSQAAAASATWTMSGSKRGRPLAA